jgi:hypothetical protein
MGGDDSRFIAFWELHDVPGTADLETNLCRAAGVPDFINHIAFAVPTAEELDRRKARWLAAGRDVLEIDHGWCHSIYTRTPTTTWSVYNLEVARAHTFFVGESAIWVHNLKDPKDPRTRRTILAKIAPPERRPRVG